MERRAFRAFTATPDAAGDARRFVRDVVEGCAEHSPGFFEVVDPAAQLATEFVSDALAHRPDEVHVLAQCLDDRLRVEVYDTHRASTLSVNTEPETQSIRMRLLDELADRWAMEDLGSGQLNWFELRLPAHPCAGPDD